jgi:alanine-synthesizing transaminase
MRFSSRVRGELAPNEFSSAVEAIRAARIPCWDLTVSNPTVAGFEYPLEEIREALAEGAKQPYRPDPRGLPAARSAVATYYHERGIAVSPESVLLASGTSEAYGHLFKLLCAPGKNILYPTPSYPLIPLLAELEGVEARPYALSPGDARWDPAALFDAFTPRARAAVAVSPNNPTGSMLTERELRELSGFCAAHRLALIVDEVFLDYPAPGRAGSVVSAAGNPDVLTFTLGGLSKACGLPQMKLSWIAVSGPEADVRQALARLEFIADAYLSVGTPVQAAAPALLGLGTRVREQIAGRIAANAAALDALPASARSAKVLPRDGGWYAVIELPAGMEDEAFALGLLQTERVLVQPGYFFDYDDAQTAVVSLLAPEDVFAEGMGKIISYLRSRPPD